MSKNLPLRHQKRTQNVCAREQRRSFCEVTAVLALISDRRLLGVMDCSREENTCYGQKFSKETNDILVRLYKGGMTGWGEGQEHSSSYQ